jgi:hypothetical protein
MCIIFQRNLIQILIFFHFELSLIYQLFTVLTKAKGMSMELTGVMRNAQSSSSEPASHYRI